jgi:ribosomal-protein-alanine N-acetyltransferase
MLHTARLTLRPFRESDADALHLLWTDPGVRRYLWDDVVIPREQTESVLARAIRSAKESGVGIWSVMLPEYIGFCGLRHVDDTPRIEILFGLYPAFQGKGLAFEAASAVIAYAFGSGLTDCIYGRTDEPNVGSIRLLERLGMQFEEKTAAESLPVLVYSIHSPSIHSRVRIDRA